MDAIARLVPEAGKREGTSVEAGRGVVARADTLAGTRAEVDDLVDDVVVSEGAGSVWPVAACSLCSNLVKTI